MLIMYHTCFPNRSIRSLAEIEIRSLSCWREAPRAHFSLRASCGRGPEAQPPAGSGAEPQQGVRGAEPPGKFLAFSYPQMISEHYKNKEFVYNKWNRKP